MRNRKKNKLVNLHKFRKENLLYAIWRVVTRRGKQVFPSQKCFNTNSVRAIKIKIPTKFIVNLKKQYNYSIHNSCTNIAKWRERALLANVLLGWKLSSQLETVEINSLARSLKNRAYIYNGYIKTYIILGTLQDWCRKYAADDRDHTMIKYTFSFSLIITNALIWSEIRINVQLVRQTCQQLILGLYNTHKFITGFKIFKDFPTIQL